VGIVQCVVLCVVGGVGGVSSYGYRVMHTSRRERGGGRGGGREKRGERREINMRLTGYF
jgi:hypothetical protein